MTDTNTLTPTDADIIALADKTRTGEPGRDGYILPISFARAVLAKWGSPAPASQPVAATAGMQPVARIRYERNTPGRENEMPRVLSCNRMADGVYEVFTAAQVQAMLSAGLAPGWQAVPVEPTMQGGTECGTGMLGSPEEAARVYRTMLAAAPSGPAREPLSQERLQFLSGEYEDIPEEGVAFRDGWRSAEMHHGITAAPKGVQHGTE